MKVMKFGGTSVGSAQRIKNVADLISAEKGNVVVLSAMSGTTDTLVEISGYLYNRNPDGAHDTINRLAAQYRKTVAELYSTDEYKAKAASYVKGVFDYITSFTKALFGEQEEKIILAQGELISTHLMAFYLLEKGINVALLSALDFMRIDFHGEPDAEYIKEHATAAYDAAAGADLYVTQGFICRNPRGDVDNLKRGGSDYTASLLGAALGADEIQIWTDIDGMHNNDPRIVSGTRAVRHLHFEEAAELGYFGAKILHPTCVLPARYANIPVRLLNTLDPSAPGTTIDNVPEPGTIKSVAAKNNITEYLGMTKSEVRPGMLIYEDIHGDNNGDGTYAAKDGKITAGNDFIRLSEYSSNPYGCTLNLGATYKSLSLQAQLSAGWGAKMLVNTDFRNAANSNYGSYEYVNMPSAFSDMFNYQDIYDANGNITVPANLAASMPNMRYSNVNAAASSFWLIDATAITLRNVTLAYTLPKSWVKHIGISNVRLNLTVQNALNFINNYPDKSWASWGGNYGRYPNLRKYTMGINVSF